MNTNESSLLNVGVLGPTGTFSEEAFATLIRKCPYHFVKSIYFRTIANVMEALIRRDVAYALVPIENSTSGTVEETIHTIIKHSKDGSGIHAVAAVSLPIKHHIWGKADVQLAEIRRIYSKRQAFIQCHESLKGFGEKLGEFEQIETDSVAAALDKVATSVGRNSAAIAGNGGSCYGLERLASGIEDNPRNTTRFYLFSAEDEGSKFGLYPTAVLIRTRDEVGAINKITATFMMCHWNIRSFHSIPMGPPGEYTFFVEAIPQIRGVTLLTLPDRAVDDFVEWKDVLAALRCHATSIHVIGSGMREY